jgi:serine/threonine protein kinase
LTDLGFIIAIEIFMQIVEGVKYLHEQNLAIIHRDLKPANILFKIESKNCHIKLGDYGLVALHEFSERSTDKFVNEVNTYAEQSYTTNVGD